MRYGLKAASRRTYLVAVFAAILGTSAASAGDREPPAQRDLQRLVDALKVQLAIEASVTTTIVATNPLLVSVQPIEGAFVMSFEERFLGEVDDEELRAIVAHELGHVWIFTHHPYLQTERLANQVAMRAVSRDSLERAYTKVWQRGGVKGDLAQFLGP
jgi:hypothetical protein